MATWRMGMEHLSQGLKRLQIWDGKRSKMNGRETEVQTLARIQVFFSTFCKSELVGRCMNSIGVSIFCVLKIRGPF